ncbi:MAG: HD domain-containing protein, partial [Clostridia bacterium]|nr:HD domain-containing protein [Clostridia bacterium]
MNIKEEFISIYQQNIKRDGADKLLAWLETTDFFTCPASTKFHSNFETGLVEHSVKVYHRLKKMGATEQIQVSDETLAIVALLHDVCKANTYKVDYRNVKRDGEWVKEPYYTVDDQLPYGHGEKSVYII